MRRLPVRYDASTLRRWSRWHKLPSGNQRPKRAEPQERDLLYSQYGAIPGSSIVLRIRLAWGVFTGRYDALDWDSDIVGLKRRMKGESNAIAREAPGVAAEK